MRNRFWAKGRPAKDKKSRREDAPDDSFQKEINRPTATAFELLRADGSSMGIFGDIVSGKRALDQSVDGKKLLRCEDGTVIAERKGTNELPMRRMRDPDPG